MQRSSQVMETVEELENDTDFDLLIRGEPLEEFEAITDSMPIADTTARGERRTRWLGASVVFTLLVGVGSAWLGVGLLGLDTSAGASISASVVDAPEADATPPAEAVQREEMGQPQSAQRHAVTADPRWVARISAESGIPERAMQAYADAALRLREERPTCGLGWNTLAAIGYVESAHGSIDGAALDADGRALPRILGVALDGTRFDAVLDTDGGEIDGDSNWDRAVGPMQFLPSTWALYSRTGSSDIDLIDDAALAAATMLCSAGTDLRVPQHWIDAVDGYNPSLDYNNEVAETASYYGSFG